MHESTASPAEERPIAGEAPTTAIDDAGSLDDPRVLQILSTEHWSLLSGRSLAYNEAFTRASMFLSFLSMSFVGLALLAQAMSFTHEYLIVATIVLGFDFIIGQLTFIRVAGANIDDARAMHGMNRIRHGYVQIAPAVAPYFTTGTSDDLPSLLLSYGAKPRSWLGDLGYGLSTSLGMVGIIVSLVAGLLGGVVALTLDAPGWTALVVAGVTAIVAFAIGSRWAVKSAYRTQAELPVLFPSQTREMAAPEHRR